MANEITTTLLETNGGLVDAVVGPIFGELTYDPSDLRSLMTYVPFMGTGSDTMKPVLTPVPGAFTAATSETDGSNVTNSAWTTDDFSLTPAAYRRLYQATDLVPIAGGPLGDVAQGMARTLSMGVGLTMTDLLAALFPSLSNSVGTSGVDMSTDDFYDATFQLSLSNVTGRYACVLHGQQINDLITSLRNEPGALQFQQATADMLAAKGPGFKGSLLNVDFYQSDSVTSSGGNYRGAMFGQGCFAYTLGAISAFQPHVPASHVIANLQNVLLLELVRDAGNGMTSILGHMYPAVAEVEDARGVLISTDA